MGFSFPFSVFGTCRSKKMLVSGMAALDVNAAAPAYLSNATKQVNLMVAALKQKPAEGVSADPNQTHTNVMNVGKGLCQAVRAFHFVVQGEPKIEDASSVTADLVKATEIYALWASTLLAVGGPVVRKLALLPCSRVLHAVLNVLAKASVDSGCQAPDVGQVEASVAGLEGLAITGNPKCST